LTKDDSQPFSLAAPLPFRSERMQGYNRRKRPSINTKKRNPIGKYNIERKNAFTNVRLCSLVLPAKQANILFDPFAHSINNVTTIVNGDDIINSRITHHYCRLYHNFDVHTRTDEYLFNMPFIAHSLFNVFRVCIYTYTMYISFE
jgi:hypothetical protein